MGRIKCDWCLDDDLYENYHDKEWGVPIYDDKLLFEFLTLETFQSGLSWITILRKRDHFKKAFDGFDYRKIAMYDSRKENLLLSNPDIIRNCQKIGSTIKNARALMEIQKMKGSFTNYIWEFVSGEPIVNQYKSLSEIPNQTNLWLISVRILNKMVLNLLGPRLSIPLCKL